MTGQILTSSYIFVQFSCFEFLTKLSHKNSSEITIENHNYKTLVNFLCGGVAASIATLVNQPIDILRTRFVAQGQKKVIEKE